MANTLKTSPNLPPSIWDVVIIGSGPAGLTAAIYTTRATLKTLILGGSRWGGQLMLTTDVENFPGFPQGIQGPELMSSLRQQAERLKGTFSESDLTSIDLKVHPFLLKTDNESYQARSVIIATGASANWLGLPSEQKFIGRGVSSCAPCDAAFFKDKKVAVVGGGDSALEEALVLTKLATQVILIHRRSEFRASQIMQDQVRSQEKITILYDTQITEILGDQKVTGVKLKTTSGSQPAKKLKASQLKSLFGQILEDSPQLVSWQMPIDGVFIAVGHTPNTQIFTGQIDLDEKGYIKVKDQTHTNIEGVFVAGDCADFRYRQAITAAAAGCMAALDLEKWLRDHH